MELVELVTRYNALEFRIYGTAFIFTFSVSLFHLIFNFIKFKVAFEANFTHERKTSVQTHTN